ncbi:MAG: hypothetical protein FJ110_07835 [Deltaproteobacteria bacterium]|nr:hypothetical protein [Deltaproteobacteria bacterium]
MNKALFIFQVVVLALLFSCGTPRPTTQEYGSLREKKERFDYTAYQPSKLIDGVKEYDKVIEEDFKNVPAGKAFILLEAKSRAIRVKAEFCNEFRTPSEEHTTVVKAWLKAFKRERYTDLFLQEVKIKEDNIEYWLPIQEQLISFLQKEIYSSEIVEFFIVYFGAYNFDHVFVINEFQKVQ